MCGIAGILAFNAIGERDLCNTKDAIKTLSLRGPDAHGVFEHKKVSLGHTRLSIIDTSTASAQPMTDVSGRYTIVYNGEFYNYERVRKDLLEAGVKFQSEGDTEVLLQLYIREGEKCVEKVNGFFAFAIYDQEEQSLFLARDRYGIKPLLYFQNEDKFIFGSELKALLAYEIPREIDNVSLFSYLQLNYVPAPYTMLENVRKLEPGHSICIKNFKVAEPLKYYNIAFNPDEMVDVEVNQYKSAQKTLYKKMDEAVERRLVSDVPLGTFLSGGIDSSIITSLAAQKVSDLSSFSIGFKDEPFFDETKYARSLAKKAGTRHTVFEVSNKDLFDNLSAVLDYFDEPFADSSAIAVYILCKETKGHISVALSGDGADEVFSGYNKHMAEYKARHPGIKEQLVKGLSPIIDKIPQSRSGSIGNFSRQLSKFSTGAKLGNKLRYWRWASIIDEEEANYLLKEKKSSRSQRLSDEAFVYKKRKDHFLRHIRKNGDLNDVLLTDVNLVLQNDMLKKVDCMSMANSLEVRTPFLDHHVVDYAFSLPVDFKINGRTRKKILIDTFKHLLPEELLNRPKKGFEVPLLKWLKNDLRPLIEHDLLSDSFVEKQGIFNIEAIHNLRSKLFSNNPGDSAATVWAIIVFQHWWKKYFLK
ncbi:MAG: asparagine synthase (glutamine-hydrolyzing) [Flavobacteriales bacterium]|nr:asparagine synthase (glutamine-hydrolyzing) [Flavobacteriales bacterium]